MAVLQDKVAVITGGARGFGLAVAHAYAGEGAKVVICSRSLASVERAVEALRSTGAQASGMACDVSDLDQVQALADQAVTTFGGFDVWVNNAGCAPPYGPTIHVEPDAFVSATQTNILGTYYGSLVAMRHFMGRGAGKLINILGIGDRRPQPMQNAYASSKAWILNFTRALAEEYKDSGVGIYALNPGMMDTEMLLNVEVVAGFERRLDVFGTVVQVLSQSPDIPARKAVWLASEKTDGRTGIVARELSMPKMLRNALGEGLRRLLRCPGRPIDIQLTVVPAAFDKRQNK
ncbi:MAG: SDR family NAD(P)-dependent oxidoreductase [Anaerolineales bacterium]|nr:SDR family NAD(P)-dependent oxidoreductase [Anaerolineales bacterium]